MTETMRDYAAWQQSLKNFEWLTGAVPGASDLDLICERRGHFLVIETKNYSVGSGIRVPFGQYLMLDALAKLPQFDVWLVGETDDPDTLYWLDLASSVPVRIRTSPVWFKYRAFRRLSKTGLADMAHGWFKEASTG